MGHLRYWWQYLTGKPEEKSTPPAAARRIKPKPAKDELRLADGERRRRPARVRSAGFDPYENDAGFGKPHTWERIERK